MKAQNKICIMISLILILLAFIGAQNVECEECRLWSFIANQGYTINGNQNDAQIQLDELYYQSIGEWPRPGQPHGWGLLCYDDNGYIDVEQRSNVPAGPPPSLVWISAVEAIINHENSFLAMGHLRTSAGPNVTPPSGMPPDPHPYIWHTNNGDWTFAHNGYVNKYQLANILAFRNWVNNLGIPNVPNTFGVPGNWWDPGVLQYVIDTELYFLFIIYHTELACGDIFMGIYNALQADELGTSGRNFTFSDGESIIAYRDGNYLSYYDNPSIDFKAVMTFPPPEQVDDWTPMLNDDLAYLQRNCDAVVFSYFATDDLFVHHLEGDESMRWNWVSFPVLEYIEPVGTNALDVLAPILDPDVLDKVVFKDYDVIWYNGEYWVNEIVDGNFHTIDGYKIKMNQNAVLPVSGDWELQTTEIPLYENQENWIGYFLDYSQSIGDAFSSIWDKWITLAGKNWAVHRYYPQLEKLRSTFTVNPGELYIVTVSEDCDLVWGTGDSKPAYVKPATEVFSYEEKADYMPIFVDSTEDISNIDEIGVLLGDECIGASKIEGFPVFIPAYIEDEDSTGNKEYNELTFQVSSYGKSGKRIIPAFIYNETQNAFVQEPIILDETSYAIVRLGTGEGIEFPKEFALYQNYPNPVKGSTTISFSTAEGAENAEIKIYNVKGQLVKTLLPTTTHQSPLTKVIWDGKDDNGKPVSSGIYFYKFTSGNKSEIKKMILLR
ncbi:MAG: T9SS type A sorting domain-containing protein [Candidatus Cloacimonetes bacterium]|nr:T9SS type A sorting domain-containing protein [Candidatus Cloacimonadota bacterium]